MTLMKEFIIIMTCIFLLQAGCNDKGACVKVNNQPYCIKYSG